MIDFSGYLYRILSIIVLIFAIDKLLFRVSGRLVEFTKYTKFCHQFLCISSGKSSAIALIKHCNIWIGHVFKASGSHPMIAYDSLFNLSKTENKQRKKPTVSRLVTSKFRNVQTRTLVIILSHDPLRTSRHEQLELNLTKFEKLVADCVLPLSTPICLYDILCLIDPLKDSFYSWNLISNDIYNCELVLYPQIENLIKKYYISSKILVIGESGSSSTAAIQLTNYLSKIRIKYNINLRLITFNPITKINNNSINWKYPSYFFLNLFIKFRTKRYIKQKWNLIYDDIIHMISNPNIESYIHFSAPYSIYWLQQSKNLREYIKIDQIIRYRSKWNFSNINNELNNIFYKNKLSNNCLCFHHLDYRQTNLVHYLNKRQDFQSMIRYHLHALVSK